MQHGSSFRDDIWHLKDVFFQPVYNLNVADVSSNYNYPQLLITTGTMVNDYIFFFSLLTTVSISHRNRLCSSLNQFSQRNIHIKFVSSKQHAQLLDEVVDLIKKEPTEYYCALVGSRNKSFHLAEELEHKPDSKLLSVYVIHVHV